MFIELEYSRKAVIARLVWLRETHGLNQIQFAERAGLSAQGYGAFENGKRSLTLEAAMKIRKTYGVSLEFLYFGNIEDLPHRMAKLL